MSEAKFRNVSVHCHGAVLEAVEEKAGLEGLSFPRAVAMIIDEWRAASEVPAAAPVQLFDLSVVSFDDLIDELVGRFVQSVSPELLAAAIMRAESAEGQLATIRQALDGVRPQA